MLRFTFTCQRCSSALEASSDQCGRSGKCPTCGGLFIIPEVDTDTGLAVSAALVADDGQLPTPMHAYATAGSRAPKITRTQAGEQVIICPRCQRTTAVDANACTHCGMPFTMEGATEAIPYLEGADNPGRRAMIIGVASLVLFCIPIVPGLIASGIAITAIRRIVRSGGSFTDKRMAWIGLMCGLLSTAASTGILLYKFL